jgi:hypothetical protein
MSTSAIRLGVELKITEWIVWPTLNPNPKFERKPNEKDS